MRAAVTDECARVLVTQQLQLPHAPSLSPHHLLASLEQSSSRECMEWCTMVGRSLPGLAGVSWERREAARAASED
jgi:hypothetical protein